MNAQLHAGSSHCGAVSVDVGTALMPGRIAIAVFVAYACTDVAGTQGPAGMARQYRLSG